jgi:hypothetical protein
VDSDRTAVAAAQTAMHALSGAQALGTPPGADRHLVCVEERYPLNHAPLGAGLRCRDDLLAVPACLAAGRRLAVPPCSVLGEAARSG